MLRLALLVLVSLLRGVEAEEHKRSSRWHADWLVVIHHYNHSLDWVEKLPFNFHVKVCAPFHPKKEKWMVLLR